MTRTKESNRTEKKRVDFHLTIHLTKWEKRWMTATGGATFVLLLAQIISDGHP